MKATETATLRPIANRVSSLYKMNVAGLWGVTSGGLNSKSPKNQNHPAEVFVMNSIVGE